MPYIHIRVTDEGVTKEQKAELIERSTRMLSEVLGKNPATTVVVIEEVPMESWGIGGEPVDVLRARAREAASGAAAGEGEADGGGRGP